MSHVVRLIQKPSTLRYWPVGACVESILELISSLRFELWLSMRIWSLHVLREKTHIEKLPQAQGHTKLPNIKKL